MNLRQYRRSGIVQAAEVLADTDTDQVTVRDANGGATTLSMPGRVRITAGAWVVLLPNGGLVVMPAEEFAAEWEPCGGALLS